MADDLGYGELGCYGQKLIKTPRIDELAQQGLRFTHFHCGAPVCAPSRCTLMTGKHSGHAAIRNNRQPKGLESCASKYGWEAPGQQPLPEREVTIAELLKAQRLRHRRDRQMGTRHVRHQRRPEPPGFRFVLRLLVPGTRPQSLSPNSCGETTRRNRSPATTARPPAKRSRRTSSPRRRFDSFANTGTVRSSCICRSRFPICRFRCPRRR